MHVIVVRIIEDLLLRTLDCFKNITSIEEYAMGDQRSDLGTVSKRLESRASWN